MGVLGLSILFLCVRAALVSGSGWVGSSELVEERYYHSAWHSPSGLRLLGSAVLSSLRSSELILQDGSSQPSFTMQYNTE